MQSINSLNLNLSPSTSSARSGTASRELSLSNSERKVISSRAQKNILRKVPTSTKAMEQTPTGFKFKVVDSEASTDREKYTKVKHSRTNYKNIHAFRKDLSGPQKFNSPSETRKLYK
jgi:hypothetical protein